MRERQRSSLAPAVVARAILLTACVGHAACGGDKGSTTVDVPSVDDGMDAGSDAAAADGGGTVPGDAMPDDPDAAHRTDGGVSSDAGHEPDASGANDGGLTDAATQGDADTDGATSFPGGDPTESCGDSLAQAEFAQAVDFDDEAGFAVALGTTGFGVAFQADDCGALATLPVVATGAYRTPQLMFTDCSALVRNVSLLRVSDGFRMTWVDNSADEGLELQSLVLNDALGLPDAPAPARLTTNARTEVRPAQWQLGSTQLLTWISMDPDRTHAQIEQKAADSGDASQVLVSADSGFNPTRFAAAQVGKDRGVLAFVSESTMRGAWLMPLDTAGAPAGSPVLLGSAVTTGNAVDVATRAVDGGAVVYSLDENEAYEVRFRRLNSQGALYGDDIKLVTGALRPSGAGIARLGDGYIVGFRSLPASADQRAEIRIMFITKEGNVQLDSKGRLITYLITDASRDGGRVSVRVSTDGQLLVSFLDTAASGSKLRLVRKRLDCAL